MTINYEHSNAKINSKKTNFIKRFFILILLLSSILSLAAGCGCSSVKTRNYITNFDDFNCTFLEKYAIDNITNGNTSISGPSPKFNYYDDSKHTVVKSGTVNMYTNNSKNKSWGILNSVKYNVKYNKKDINFELSNYLIPKKSNISKHFNFCYLKGIKITKMPVNNTSVPFPSTTSASLIPTHAFISLLCYNFLEKITDKDKKTSYSVVKNVVDQNKKSKAWEWAYIPKDKDTKKQTILNNLPTPLFLELQFMVNQDPNKTETKYGNIPINLCFTINFNDIDLATGQIKKDVDQNNILNYLTYIIPPTF